MEGRDVGGREVRGGTVRPRLPRPCVTVHKPAKMLSAGARVSQLRSVNPWRGQDSFLGIWERRKEPYLVNRSLLRLQEGLRRASHSVGPSAAGRGRRFGPSLLEDLEPGGSPRGHPRPLASLGEPDVLSLLLRTGQRPPLPVHTASCTGAGCWLPPGPRSPGPSTGLPRGRSSRDACAMNTQGRSWKLLPRKSPWPRSGPRQPQQAAQAPPPRLPRVPSRPLPSESITLSAPTSLSTCSTPGV